MTTGEQDIEADYKFLGSCEVGVGAPHTMSGVDDCCEPAIAKVWWEDYDKDALTVCAEHYREITGRFATEAQEKYARLERENRQMRDKAVRCPLIEEKHRQENYILYVCDCSESNPAKRQDCPFYDALEAKETTT